MHARTRNSLQSPTDSALQFAARRILRIVPPYYLATVLILVLGASNPVDLQSILKSLLFIPYLSPSSDVMRPILSHGWTLNYEMFFYLIFSFCLLFRRALGTSLMVATLVLLVVGGLAFRPLIPYSDPKDLISFYTDPMLLLFGAGVVLCALERNGWVGAWCPYPIGVVLALFAAVMAIFWQFELQFPLPIQWQLFFAAACFLAVFACSASTAATSGPIGSVLIFAGDASYSTYLFHKWSFTPCYKLYLALPAALHHPLVYLALCIIVANLIGAAVHLSIERPLNSAARRWLQQPERRKVPA